MMVEGLIANYEDLQRQKMLEKQGHFKPGFGKGGEACLGELPSVVSLNKV